ncbi:MAG TPA: circadian clock protein KaiC [Gemmatimonadaceae bacterium]
MPTRRRRAPSVGLAKSPTGINGFDQITRGGLPSGRPSLVCGGAGCGKTLFAIEFLVKGALLYDEPGVFVAFEETQEELIHNVASLGIRLDELIARKLIAFDFIRVERSEIEEAGEYDLEGLFVRLAHAVSSIKARRIAIDSLEARFSTFANEALLRAELRRLFRWLKDRKLTAVITGEKGEGALTRHGLEEYVSDCVVALDHRVVDQSSTRRMRIVKYRGSAHGTDEYPFLIDEQGFSVLPVTSLDLDYEVSTERISTGIAALDGMLEGGGYFRGSSVMVSGSAGTGKTSLATLFAAALCKRRERALYFALEESASQIQRNMASIGIGLAELRRKKMLELRAARPTGYGLEMHLVAMHNAIEQFEPRTVIIDPISSLSATGTQREVKSMLVRLFDYLKNKQITCLVTSLSAVQDVEETELEMSSLIDTWIQVRDLELAGERTRALFLIKSRGMGHSNQVREFLIGSHGIDLVPVEIGPSGVLTGSAREHRENERRTEAMARAHERERKLRQLERRRTAVEAQIAVMRAELEAEAFELDAAASEERERTRRTSEAAARLGATRSAGRASTNGERR